MRRQFIGLALSALLIAGCSSTPGPQSKGLYHSPARAYSLALDSGVFRGAVTLREQCDANGGSTNIWDSNNRFFRIDYLKIGQSPLAQVPAFASERTINEQVLSSYLGEVLHKAESLKSSESLLRENVDTGRGEAMFAVVSMNMKDSALPEGVKSSSYFYGFLVFTKGDMVYVLQHRVDSYQPDKLKQLLSGLRQDILVPGVPRGGIQLATPGTATQDDKAKSAANTDPDSILAKCG
jgi:hypothetical protein